MPELKDLIILSHEQKKELIKLIPYTGLDWQFEDSGFITYYCDQLEYLINKNRVTFESFNDPVKYIDHTRASVKFKGKKLSVDRHWGDRSMNESKAYMVKELLKFAHQEIDNE